MSVNPVDYEFMFPVAEKVIATPAGMEKELAGIAKALVDAGASASQGLDALTTGVEVSDVQRSIAAKLKSAAKAIVMLGSYAQSSASGSNLRSLGRAIAEMSGATCAFLTDGANSAGAYLAGALPHRAAAGKGATFGLNVQGMLSENLAGYVLLGTEPENDIANAAAVLAPLNLAEFVVSMTSYKSEAMLEYASVLLPIAPFTETSGTFVNVEGTWQSFSGSVKPLAETRPAWKVLRVMGNLFNLDGFEQESSEEVRNELQVLVDGASKHNAAPHFAQSLAVANDKLVRVADSAIYSIDATVRRAESLQKTPQAKAAAAARINSGTAKVLGLSDAVKVEATQGDSSCVVALKIDDRAADGTVWLSAATNEVAGFGCDGAEIALKPV